MSREQRCGRGGSRKLHELVEEEDFHDCQETLEPPDLREKEDEDTKPDIEVSQCCHNGNERHSDQGNNTTEFGVQQEAEEDRQQEEDGQQEEDNRLQEDLELEMKEEKSHQVEFDDDYLREAEKELSEEEKENRRQQSLTLKEKGNSQFKAGDWSEAEQTYTEALVLCPVCCSGERAVLFSNRAASRLHLDLKDQAISDCTKAIELNPNYLRALLRRAELYEQTEKLDEALEDYKKVLDSDPDNASARQACMRLPRQIQERNEKLKEEMMGKLKELGNMILRPFGLSTNNFQVNQNQDTGSYSINFVQSPHGNR